MQEILLEKYNLEKYQKVFVLNILKKISPNAKVLELGSDLYISIAKTIASLTNAEVIATNVEDNFPKNPIKEEGVTIMYADGRELPFEDESFEVVFSCCALEHVNGIKKFLEEARRVLKKGGFFLRVFLQSGVLQEDITFFLNIKIN